MDKCLPLGALDVFRARSSPGSGPGEGDATSPPIIIGDMSLYYYKQLAQSLGDDEMQQKIDYEIKMREGTARLLAASKHPTQLMEAAKNLLTSNTRIIAYMAELQRRKTAQVLGKSMDIEGSQTPCQAKLNVSDLRIPLMWKDSDHFKNKGDHRRYAVFCLVKIGTEIYDTALISNVDRNMTDLSFDDVIAFDNIPHDFECVIEIYCHKLHEDLTMASTPRKLKKKVAGISESVGRGPKFEMVASGVLSLQDVDDVVRTFDLKLEVPNGEDRWMGDDRRNTQICEADPRTSQRAHTFHTKTLGERFISETTFAADNQDQLTMWWDGLQQHLLDQAFWKQACEFVMDVQRAPNRKSSIMSQASEPLRLSEDLRVEDDKLTAMLTTLMGEAKEIRSGRYTIPQPRMQDRC
ncbi:RTKN-like protein [Mya arenaria]|uniref:RTKN-like protein n=1 Tax=Mya arenaria TaxID=6604 RepID=A0ABY7FFQ4_MYAAR|nr:RTKN-like protein [Mya arenaria]